MSLVFDMFAQEGNAPDPNVDKYANTNMDPDMDPDEEMEVDKHTTDAGVNANTSTNAGSQDKFKRHVRLEEVVDEDHIRAPGVRQPTNYKRLLNEQRSKGKGRYGAFGDKEVWETSQFMVDCLGKGATDWFLGLPRVSSHNRLFGGCVKLSAVLDSKRSSASLFHCK